MPFDHFVTGAVARELNMKLRGGKIERVYQPERHELILNINTQGAGRASLLISAAGNHPYLYISENKQGNPMNPPAFCMLLRKHLVNARIDDIFRVGTERIIRIETDSPDELGTRRKRTLLFEIMGKHSNIILLDENDMIIDAIKRVHASMSRVRQTLPGMPYAPPPPGKGISPIMESEREFREYAHYESRDAEGDYAPIIYMDTDGRMKDFHVFHLKVMDNFTIKSCPSVSEMLESYYDNKETGNRRNQKSADLRHIIKNNLDKLYLKQQRLLEDVEKAKNADTYRIKGELITANIYKLTQGMREAELDNFYAQAKATQTDATQTPNSETESAQENSSAKTIKVALDPLLSPAKNAQRYFKKYAKAKTALTEKAKQLEIVRREIAYIESYTGFLDSAEDDADIDNLREELTDLGYVRRRGTKRAKRAIKKEFLKYETSTGLQMYVGRNNRENDELTLRKAGADDLWLHTKDIPGSHVILKRGSMSGVTGASGAESTDGIPAGFDQSSILEAARTAAYYSKGKDSESVPVDYCLVKYVKKPSGAKPGMVVFTHNRTVYVTPCAATLPTSS